MYKLAPLYETEYRAQIVCISYAYFYFKRHFLMLVSSFHNGEPEKCL